MLKPSPEFSILKWQISVHRVSALQGILVKLKRTVTFPIRQNSVQTLAGIKYQVLIAKTKEDCVSA